MPEEDPGDVFLRHRGAVLDALLSAPTGTPPAKPPADQSDLPPAVAPPADKSTESADLLSADLPSSDLPSADAPPAGRPSVEAPSSDLPPLSSAPLDTPPPGLSPGLSRGASARSSDRINALLNGRDLPEPDSDYSGRSFAGAGSETISALRSSGVEAEIPHASQLPDDASGSSSGQAPSSGLPRTADEFLRRYGPRLRQPKVLLIIGVVIAVLLILLLIFTSGSDNTASHGPLVITPSAQPAKPSTPQSGTPAGTQIKVRSAASHCPPGSTSAMDAFKGQAGSAWSCVRAYHVDGQVLTIDLGKSYQVDSISIVPGWDHVDPNGTDEWNKHRTAHRVSYEFDDPNSTTYTQETLDQRKPVVTQISPAVTASHLTLTILESAGDRSLNDTAVSSIIITGH